MKSSNVTLQKTNFTLFVCNSNYFLLNSMIKKITPYLQRTPPLNHMFMLLAEWVKEGIKCQLNTTKQDQKSFEG